MNQVAFLTYEALEGLSRKELRRRISDCLQWAAEAAEADRRLALLNEANFYITQLDRRHDSWISTRDLILEIVVIGLIGWELILGYNQEREQHQAFTEEQTIWQNMEKSSDATANTLGAVEKTMELTSGTLQNELALFYDVALSVVIDPYDGHVLDVVNTGRTNVTFWGIGFGSDNPIIRTETSVIPPGAGIRLDWFPFFDEIIRKFPDPTAGSVQFEVYVKNARGEEFIQHGNVAIHWASNIPTLTSETTRIEPEDWSTTRAMKAAPAKAP